MGNSFVDYFKVVLERVSFCDSLLNAEYERAVRSLNIAELAELHDWMAQKNYLSFSKQNIEIPLSNQ